MFIGHYGIALGVHAIYPAATLPVLMVATQAIDIVWAGLVLAGVEKLEIRKGATATTPLNLYHMPYSHSLAGAFVISAAATGLAAIAGVSGTSIAVVFTVAFSHWLLDLLVHDGTLQITKGGAKAGFGLWRNRPISVALEYAIILGGVMLYYRYFAPLSGQSMLALSIFAGAAMLVQGATFFGPPPKSVPVLGVTILGLFLAFTLGSFWLDQSGTILAF
ncbi:MAG: hypothetical protein ACI8R4_001209 [Paracoccaceae bacterium]|jgi:hypothetical protein